METRRVQVHRSNGTEFSAEIADGPREEVEPLIERLQAAGWCAWDAYSGAWPHHSVVAIRGLTAADVEYLLKRKRR